MADNLQPSPFSQSLNRFSEVLTPAEIQSILNLQEDPLPIGIRVNPLKVDPQTSIKNWAEWYQWELKPVNFYPYGWTISSAGISPGTTIEHRMGQYYLQDAASMVPVSLFEFAHPQPLILDMAASPGGKTTHLIDRTQDRGFVVANDASQGRIPALRSVLANWGGINLVITRYPGESFGQWFPEMFDMVLLDVPCTMENLRPTPNHPLRETTTDERLRLQSRQVELLTSGLQALKIGGQIVYATCSLAPEEDEAVIDRIMRRFPGAISIENVAQKFSFHTPGLTQFQGERFLPDLKESLRLWPFLTGMSGFFCALLTKQKPLPVQNQISPERPFTKTGLEPTGPVQFSQVCDVLFENYEINLRDLLQRYHLAMYSRHNQIFLIPQTYLEQFSTLPYEYIGMPLGRWIDQVFEPSHAFVTRFGHQFNKGKILIEDALIQLWIAGRDIRHPETEITPQGQFLMVIDRHGRNLGLGRLLPKRLRNMLPRQYF